MKMTDVRSGINDGVTGISSKRPLVQRVCLLVHRGRSALVEVDFGRSVMSLEHSVMTM